MIAFPDSFSRLETTRWNLSQSPRPALSLRRKLCGVFGHSDRDPHEVLIDSSPFRIDPDELLLVPGESLVGFPGGSARWCGVTLSDRSAFSGHEPRDETSLSVFLKERLVRPLQARKPVGGSIIPFHRLASRVAPFPPLYLASQTVVTILTMLQAADAPKAAPAPREPASPGQGYLISLVKDYLGQHYREKITLDQIAWYVRVSREHLARTFKAAEGETVFEALRKIRIAEVGRLLVETDETLETIAEKTGFASAPLLCRTFKQQLNCTPTRFRERYRRSGAEQ
ncbi:MAG TPA: AraC family transcriptional regulator [Chthoniobacteraceae bacterium]|nr:AraC family transcriptional regulator [Chthoniobacteraceae bacterium]